MSEYIKAHKSERGYVQIFSNACESESEKIINGIYDENLGFNAKKASVNSAQTQDDKNKANSNQNADEMAQNSTQNTLATNDEPDENAPSFDELVQSGALSLGAKNTKATKKKKDKEWKF